MDSDALTQFSGSLTDQEENGAVRMNQEERIMSDVSECMLDDGGEMSSESECLSGKSSRSAYFNQKYTMPKVTVCHGNDKSKVAVRTSLTLNKVFVLE